MSKANRFLKLLEQFAGTALECDAISKRISETQPDGLFQYVIHNELSSPLSENVVFQAMMSLARSFSDSNGSGHRYFIADLKSNSITKDAGNDMLLAILFLSLIQRQLQEDIRGKC